MERFKAKLFGGIEGSETADTLPAAAPRLSKDGGRRMFREVPC